MPPFLGTPRADLPGPLLRRGPRPLLLHLMLAAQQRMTRSAACATAWESWSVAWRSWNEQHGQAHDPDAVWPQAAGPDPGLANELLAGLQEDQALIAGIAAYRRHPSRRILADPPAVWAEGETRLLDYADGATPGGARILFVPSLINRPYILDLAPDHSLLRYLAAAGLAPLLLDWGWPDEAARRFTLTDYIAGVLDRALTAIEGTVILAGYCMGGLLALALAQRRPDRVRGLALLATPWDFRAHDADQADRLAQLVPALGPVLDFSSTLPIDMVQALFALLDPGAVAAKFRRFARLDQAGAQAALFVAIEDWANDGMPLAAAVARECFGQWYGRNTPMRGEWRVAGMAVRPEHLAIPSFVAVPGRDRIVPPASARPLAALLRGATVIEPPAGHVGMIAGTRAEAALWRPLRDWLAAVAGAPV